jgi:hypothetical protein
MRNFSIPFNYFYYQQAVYNTFLFQNNRFLYSWFLIFDQKDEVNYLPSWFDQCWVLFGAETNFAYFLTDKFESYTKNNHSTPFAKFSRLLDFVVHYNISWIMGWDYEISVGTSIKYITKRISIR